jgi:hypothetical protein
VTPSQGLLKALHRSKDAPKDAHRQPTCELHPHLQFTPGHLHPGLGVQALVDSLEGAPAQLDVELKEAAVQRGGYGLEIVLIVLLLLGLILA